MKSYIVREIAGYADACKEIYDHTQSLFHRGQMLGYLNALQAIGGRDAKRLQSQLQDIYNGWIDGLEDAS